VVAVVPPVELPVVPELPPDAPPLPLPVCAQAAKGRELAIRMESKVLVFIRL
jgi:hypothetical protein